LYQHVYMQTCRGGSMRVVTLLSQKGGTGKTTIALHLAVAAELDGKSTAVIDLDPQQSAALWGDTRASETPVVVSAQPARLQQVLDTAREHNAAWVSVSN
ncbi:MAG TPA: ParA family protein, partial [Gammaproteobacteria bacterium]|nr:ParA family protein [Gammaproteobacteria bacterium]